jgi:hypothetical protein
MPGANYSQYLVDKPIREAGSRYELKNRTNPSMTFLSSILLPLEARQRPRRPCIWSSEKVATNLASALGTGILAIGLALMCSSRASQAKKAFRVRT